MTKQEFIFSNDPSHRITRHLVFWIVYSFYFWMQSIVALDPKEVNYFEPYKNALVNLYCFLPSCIFSVYIFIYVFLPYFLEKRKYLLFGISFILLYGFELYINRFFGELFLDKVTYHQVTELSFITAWGLSTTNTLWAYTIAILALGIKLAKNKYLQQQENLALVKKKATAELHFQKARIHPDFLSGTLDNIYHRIYNCPNQAPEMVLKLSDFLSYTLYEGESELILLEREINIVRDFILLNKAQENSLLEIDFCTSGAFKNKYIVPMQLLKIVQDTLTLLKIEKTGTYQIIFDVKAENTCLTLQLRVFLTGERKSSTSDWSKIIQDTQQKLNSHFAPEQFNIQQINEQNLTNIKITLPLANKQCNQHISPKTNTNLISYDLK